LTSRVPGRQSTLVACEGALIVAVIVLATRLRLPGTWWQVLTAGMGLAKAILIAIVCQVCLYCSGLYDLRIVSDHRELIVRSLQALGATSLVFTGLYYWFPDLIIGRGVFLISAAFLVTVIVGWRVAFGWATRRA
jgi:hypothetical protein